MSERQYIVVISDSSPEAPAPPEASDPRRQYYIFGVGLLLLIGGIGLALGLTK